VSGRAPGNALVPSPVSRKQRDRLNDVPVAVIGCGAHSTTTILPALRHAPLRLIAVCDLDADRAEAARVQFGAERTYQSIGDLLASATVEAVLVVGPPELHVAAGVAALESGHHVFVEKPPGSTLADAERLRVASEAAGRHVMVGFMKRHATGYRLLKRILAEPDFGDLTSISYRFSHWAVDGIQLHLTDMSIHALDLVRWLAGDPVRMSVYKRARQGTNHSLAVMFDHAGACVSQLDLSAFGPGVIEHLSATGQQSNVDVDNLVLLSYARHLAGLPEEAANSRIVSSWSPEFALPDPENDSVVLQGYAGELVEFAAAIQEDRAPNASIEDGVAAMRLIEAIVAAPEGLTTVDLAAQL